MALQLTDRAGPAGERREIEGLEIELLLAGVAKRYGYDFRHYARASLTRRVLQVLRREALSSISALQERVLREPVAMARFVEAVGVHTTSMFRDPDVFKAFRTDIVPLLRTYPFVRIWCAGCSSGEEVYSLAILLQEEGVYDRCRIYATDISDAVLERAMKGVFPLAVMRQYQSAYLASGGLEEFSSYYATDAQNAVLRKALRRNVIFSQHNLVCDGVFNEFHLVLCRNVAIYFDQTLRSHVHELFHQSLARFGVLVIGKKESLRFTTVEHHYEELIPDHRVFRKTS